MQIEGVPSFYERPNFTKENFQKSPAYHEWRKMVDKLNPGMPLSSIIEIHDKKYYQQAAAASETDFKVPGNYTNPESLIPSKKEIIIDTKNRTGYNNKSIVNYSTA